MKPHDYVYELIFNMTHWEFDDQPSYIHLWAPRSQKRCKLYWLFIQDVTHARRNSD